MEFASSSLNSDSGAAPVGRRLSASLYQTGPNGTTAQSPRSLPVEIAGQNSPPNSGSELVLEEREAAMLREKEAVVLSAGRILPATLLQKGPNVAAVAAALDAASSKTPVPGLPKPPAVKDVGFFDPNTVGDLTSQWDGLAITTGIESSQINLEDSEGFGMSFVSEVGGYLLGSILTSRPFSVSGMKKLLFNVWHSIHEVQMEEVGQNLFLFGFAHRMDLNKVVREGPWRFNRHFLVLREIEDPNCTDRAMLERFPIWMQIHEVPPQWLSVTAAKSIAIKVGEVLEVDPGSAGFRGYGFLRVRVMLDIGAPLPRSISVLNGKKSVVVKFKYERLENFCLICGYMDHVEDDCPKSFEPGYVKGTYAWSENMRAIPLPKHLVRHNPGPGSFGSHFGSVSPIRPLGYSNAGRFLASFTAPSDMVFRSGRYESPSKKRAIGNSPLIPPGFGQNRAEKRKQGEILTKDDPGDDSSSERMQQ